MTAGQLCYPQLVSDDDYYSLLPLHYTFLFSHGGGWIHAVDDIDDVTAGQRQRDKYETYCETETFNATCDESGDVILVTHALYGRMQLSRCTKIDYGHIGCSSDVTELADARCSGRQACEIAIPDALFAKSQPCPEDLKPYLEVGYTCLSGMLHRDGSLFICLFI